jgi:hypothetical protein
MTSTRRKPSTGFTAPVEELPVVAEETTVEETVVNEELEVEKEVEEEAPLEKPAQGSPPVVVARVNPEPFRPLDIPRRNTPKFSTKG